MTQDAWLGKKLLSWILGLASVAILTLLSLAYNDFKEDLRTMKTELNEKIDDVDNKIDAVDEKLTDIRAKTGEIRLKVEVRDKLDSIFVQDLRDHENRIRRLEGR
jgi:peptidoglycan hydrolase CwlO-like protein